jgi:hypothetical protein
MIFLFVGVSWLTDNGTMVTSGVSRIRIRPYLYESGNFYLLLRPERTEIDTCQINLNRFIKISVLILSALCMDKKFTKIPLPSQLPPSRMDPDSDP